jgi:hypothetical protein
MLGVFTGLVQGIFAGLIFDFVAGRRRGGT